MAAGAELRKWHLLLRYIVKFFIPQVQSLWADNIQATDLLRPIVKQREIDENTKGYVKPMDAIEWTRDLLPINEKKDYKYIAMLQLALGTASIHTISQLLSNALFDLAAYPEYIITLREEVEQVLEQNSGEWNVERMGQLKKMDSFLKESQRHFTATVVSFQRKTLKPVTLSDGTYFPKNTVCRFFPSVLPSQDISPNQFYHFSRENMSSLIAKVPLT